MSSTPDKNATAPEPLRERRIVSEFTDGGHEIDRPPAATLFGFLVAMGIIIIGSAIGVYQLFVAHSDEEAAQLANQPLAQQLEQANKDQRYFTTWGVVTTEGQPSGYRMPIATARDLVLRDPSRFAPAAPPAGWVHPDDAPAAPAPQPDPKP